MAGRPLTRLPAGTIEKTAAGSAGITPGAVHPPSSPRSTRKGPAWVITVTAPPTEAAHSASAGSSHTAVSAPSAMLAARSSRPRQHSSVAESTAVSGLSDASALTTLGMAVMRSIPWRSASRLVRLSTTLSVRAALFFLF